MGIGLSFSRKSRFIFSICFFVGINLTVTSASPVSITPGVGILVDVAPYGIEQYLAHVQCTVSPKEFPYLSTKPSFLWNDRISMIRIPGLVNLAIVADQNSKAGLSVFGGVGIEYYRSDAHNTDSLYITSGSEIILYNMVLEFYFSRAYRGYNTDSDFGIILGYRI